jgi:DNA-binding transcriptional regulator LsrR (DeoR family)
MGDRKLTESQISLYTRIAYYYYKEGSTQEQIAKRLKLSRRLVNRILRICIERGIVQISIQNMNGSNLELENRIKNKYKLLDIRIVNILNEENFFKDIAIAMGEYLASTIQDGDVIGITRGRTLAALAEYMPVLNKKKLTVVQLLGSRNNEQPNTAINQIVHNFSNKLNAAQSLLFAPIAVQNAELKQYLYKDPVFIDAYKVMKTCTMVITSIGTSDSLEIFAKHIGAKGSDAIELKDGQVLTGEVCTYFIDQAGEEVKNLYRDRVISIELNDFLEIPRRIGVAGLPVKAKAIHAALLGKYVNTLIIDKATAEIIDRL